MQRVLGQPRLQSRPHLQKKKEEGEEEKRDRGFVEHDVWQWEDLEIKASLGYMRQKTNNGKKFDIV